MIPDSTTITPRLRTGRMGPTAAHTTSTRWPSQVRPQKTMKLWGTQLTFLSAEERRRSDAKGPPFDSVSSAHPHPAYQHSNDRDKIIIEHLITHIHIMNGYRPGSRMPGEDD